MAVDPKKVHVINLIKHCFKIVPIFSLTRIVCLCYNYTQPPNVKSDLTSCFLPCALVTHALASCDFGTGEPLEKPCVEPFKTANLAFKAGLTAKALIFLYCFYFLTKKKKRSWIIFPVHLPLILSNAFLRGREKLV